VIEVILKEGLNEPWSDKSEILSPSLHSNFKDLSRMSHLFVNDETASIATDPLHTLAQGQEMMRQISLIASLQSAVGEKRKERSAVSHIK
jgi:hypothetical protein